MIDICGYGQDTSNCFFTSCKYYDNKCNYPEIKQDIGDFKASQIKKSVTSKPIIRKNAAIKLKMELQAMPRGIICR